jgi:serine/threonine-protein kinase
MLPDPAPTSRTPDTEGAAPAVPSTDPPAAVGRFPVEGELGRGGMGAVYKARDPDLGRPLAVKVLRAELAGDAAMARRFLEEARVAGQLQHPGVAPVHEVGRTADGRPFIAMKLVRGRTLADLLAGRKAPSDDLPRFISIFEQACQALAYAHSRGVVHRDVKPANVMVGDFGEVQVMDWGLAKVLAAGGPAEEPTAGGTSTLYTARGGEDATRAGSVLGTLAYMPPEQARGEVRRVDERSDVFGLGAMLCEILTGAPPYAGAQVELHRQARQADLEAAQARLAACGADAELVGLARACLAPEPDGRPRDAGKVVAAVAAYRAGVQERLRRVELAQAAAEAKAAEGRKRRRVLLALAAVVLLALTGAGAAAWWYAQDRAARQAAAAEVGRAATTDLDEALAGVQEGKYAEARLALQRAEGRLAGGGPDGLRARADELRADLDALDAFDEARLEATALRADVSDFDVAQGARRYAAAFASLGIPVAELDESEAAARVGRRAIREQLVEALDDWAGWAPDAAEAGQLVRVAEAADPEPGGPRALARRALRDRDPDELRRAAAAEAAADTPDGRLMERLAGALWKAGRPEEALGLLEAALRRRPADFWVNHSLAEVHSRSKPPRYDEAARYFSVAAALRPGSPGVWVNLGNALLALKRPGEAAAAYRKALDLRPEYAVAHGDFGIALFDLKRPREAEAEFRRALALQPDLANAHYNLGAALQAKGRTDEAIAEYRKALALQTDFAKAHNKLGEGLLDRKRPREAEAEFRRALALQPDLVAAHCGLGAALVDLRRPWEAADEYHKALALQTDDAQAHNGLGVMFLNLRRPKEAADEYRRALALRPDLVEAHCNLGIALLALRRPERAASEFRRALALRPDDALSHYDFGNALLALGRPGEAAAEYRRALALRPDLLEAHCGLGNALRALNRPEEAAAAYRRALALRPDDALAHNNLGLALFALRQPEEAASEFRKALALRPDDAEAHCGLGAALNDLHRPEEAAEECREALALRPDFAEAHCNLGNALLNLRRPGEAAEEYRRALALRPDDALVHHDLGNALLDLRQPGEAAEEYRRALALRPDLAEAHFGLGNALFDLKRLGEAAEEYRRALALRPDYAPAHNNLGNALRDLNRSGEAAEEYRRALDLQPDYAPAHSNLANALRDLNRPEEAAEECRRALALQPDYVEAHFNLGWALRDLGRFAESLREFRRGHELGTRRPDWAYPSAEWVRAAERLAELDAALPAVFQGAAEPAGPADASAMAQMCLVYKRRYAAAARLFADAFSAEPSLSADPAVGRRYNAACAAALAAAGRGEDASALTKAERDGLRRQALAWLRDDLTGWSKLLDGGDASAREAARQALAHWKEDADLAGLRDADAVGKLPEDEPAACRQLWADVDAFLEKAGGK